MVTFISFVVLRLSTTSRSREQVPLELTPRSLSLIADGYCARDHVGLVQFPIVVVRVALVDLYVRLHSFFVARPLGQPQIRITGHLLETGADRGTPLTFCGSGLSGHGHSHPLP